MKNHHLPKGTLLDGQRYEIVEVLGEGGFGITYTAKDSRLNNHLVAIKELYISQYCKRQEDGEVRPDNIAPERFAKDKARFVSEAHTLIKFDHPNIVKAQNVFEENGTAYLVLNFIQGKTLQQWVADKGGAVPFEQMQTWVGELGSALKEIHQKDFYHLDIKPSNIMIRKRDNKPILIDFGLCENLDTSDGMTENPAYSAGYSAPEYQDGTFKKHKKYPQLDIYALAATAFFMSTTGHPQDVGNRKEVMRSWNVPEAMQIIIQKAMSKNPSKRHQSAEEFARQIKAVLKPPPPPEDRYKTQYKQQKTEQKKRPVLFYSVGFIVLLLLLFGLSNWNSLSTSTVLTDQGVINPKAGTSTETSKDEDKDDTGTKSGETDDNEKKKKEKDSDSDTGSTGGEKPPIKNDSDIGDIEKRPSTPKTLNFSGNITQQTNMGFEEELKKHLITLKINAPLGEKFTGTCTIRDSKKTARYAQYRIRGTYKNHRLFFQTDTVIKQHDFPYCNFKAEGQFDANDQSSFSSRFFAVGATLDTECEDLLGNARINISR